MEFKRMDGFTGSVPQKFADTQIPKCPMCKTNNPHWALRQQRGKMMSLNPEENANKYLLKCEQCGCILKVPVTDVVGVGRSALLSWQGVAKKMHGKDTKTIYVTIEDIGDIEKDASHLGKEMSLEDINKLAN